MWRTAEGRPWLGASPLIEMLDEKATKRQPYPTSWSQQAVLVKQLPQRLKRMVLFALNTGARDKNVCGLQWAWERPVPAAGRSVFVIPASEFKNKRAHVLILNNAALRIVEQCRGQHDDYVFVYCQERTTNTHEEPVLPYRRVQTMNNTAFQRAREAAGQAKVRVHDLRHTFGQRLRDAGVSEEDRAPLLGHVTDGMPQHYASATVADRVDAANKVAQTIDRTTLLRMVNG